MSTAAAKEMTTTMAIERERLSSFASRMAMKRNRTWGMPKYPKPHAIEEAISNNDTGTAWPVSRLWLANRLAKPSIEPTVEATLAIPPASKKPAIRMTINEKNISVPCMKSVVLSARNPPTMV